MSRFIAINSGPLVGVIDHAHGDVWVIEPEYNWRVAKIMADCLEAEPGTDPDELTKLVKKEA